MREEARAAALEKKAAEDSERWALDREIKTTNLALLKADLALKQKMLAEGASQQTRQVSSPKRISTTARKDCFTAMRRKIRSNTIEDIEGVRSAIEEFFQDGVHGASPKTRTVYGWARELWKEHDEPPQKPKRS